MIYLASPYTDTSPQVQEDRAEAATQAAAYLLDQGRVVYAPIPHGHGISGYMKSRDKTCHKFWLNQCYKKLINSDALYILTLPRWTRSKGVRWEYETSIAFGIPVSLMHIKFDDYRIEPLGVKEWSVASIFQEGS